MKQIPLFCLLFTLFLSATTTNAQSSPLMRDFIGVNVKPFLPYSKMTRVGNTRNFHLWADDQIPGGGGRDASNCPLIDPGNSNISKIRWNPSYNAVTYTRYDDFYKLNAQRNVAVMHGSLPAMYIEPVDKSGLLVSDTVFEESVGIQDVVFKLTSPAIAPIDLNISVVGGSAIPNVDYSLPNPLTVHFDIGQTIAFFTINTIDNGFSGSTKNIQLKISTTFSNIIIGKDNFFVFINDSPGLKPIVYIKGDIGGEGTGVYPEICLTKEYDVNVKVILSSIDGSFADNTPIPTYADPINNPCAGPYENLGDYYFCNAPNDNNEITEHEPIVIIAAGDLCATLSITTYDDNVVEGEEYFGVKIDKVIPDLQYGGTGIAWIVAKSALQQELYAKPLCKDDFLNLDHHTQANSYKSLAIRASLFASRYGSVPQGGYPVNFQNIAAQYVQTPDNVGLGKGFVKYIEIMNETDASWHGADVINQGVVGAAMETDPNYITRYYFRPDQYAYLMSAVYDGNKTNAGNDPNFLIKNTNGSSTGKYWGIRNLSAANTKVILAGTADMRYDYFHFLKKEWDKMGRTTYPFDVINYHIYSTNSHPDIPATEGLDNFAWNQFYHGRAFFKGGDYKGIYPESPNVNLRARLKKLLFDRNTTPSFAATFGLENAGKLFENKPTWITEFGYDTQTGTNSGLDIEPFANFDAQTIQGQWLTRYIMEASAAVGIDKVFMYELNDDPGLNNNQFGSSGLLDGHGMQKKSWYHIRTLKSVLDMTHFDKTNEQNGLLFLETDATTPLLVDVPRIYSYVFNNNITTTPTLAAWIPKGEGAEFYGSLLLDKSKYPSITSIQVIEVVEFDEDGKRTKIDPSLITSKSIGLDNYWSINGIRPGDTYIKLTETPLYLRINQPNSESDKEIKPVQNLKASCLGCNSVKLNWEIPNGPRYSYYSIYYQEIECVPTVLTPIIFNSGNFVLSEERLIGTATSAVIPNLLKDHCYRFWVVPFTQNLNGGLSAPATYSSADMNVPSINEHYVNFKIDCSVSCEVPFTKENVKITINPGYGTYETDGFYDAILPSGDICNQLETGITPGYGIGVPGGKTLQFTIKLNETSYIDAMYIHYKSGTGRIKIEYLRDCCNEYLPAQTIDFNDNTQGINNVWYRIVNSNFNREKAESLRITIDGLLEIGLNLGSILLCARPAPEKCFTEELSSLTTTSVENPTVKYLDTNSALITWDAAKQYEDNIEIAPINQYILKYGIATNQFGEIVQAEEIKTETPEWGGDIEVPLVTLEPNTTYFVDIAPDQEAYPCLPFFPKPLRFSFTTPDMEKELTEGRSIQIKQDLPSVNISPNPAVDFLEVNVPKESYDRYILTYSNGIHIRQGNLTGLSTTLPLKGLANGMYLITLIGEKYRTQTKAFVVNQ
jgi:hypothetical protein